jgi:ATP-dependent Clp protease adaptor protein ClpS
LASESTRKPGRPQKESRLLRLAAVILAAPALLRHGLAAGAARFVWFGSNAARPPGQGDEGGNFRDNGNGSGTAVITRTKTRTKKPSMYRVLLLNDDYTPMEFVVLVLQRYFNKTADQATQIMLHVHRNGVGECGVFTYEVAETKVTQVMDFAHKHQHPLQCIMEKK